MQRTPCRDVANIVLLVKHQNDMIGVRGFPERDISSLCAFGLGGGQVSRVVRVSAPALFDVLG